MMDKSLNRQIINLAFPSILANITVPLVGIVDTAIVGHISNAVAIGGIAIGTMLFDLLYWNFAFLRAGTGGLTAQAFGRQDTKRQGELLTQGIFIALCGALLIWLIQWLFVNGVLFLVPCSDDVAHFARTYFFIRIWAAPATLANMAIKGWLIGMQNTVGAMICDLSINITNIIVSYLLAFHTPLGVMGVAWGTLIAQYTGLLAGATIIVYKYKYVFEHINIKETLRWQKLRQLFVFNANLFVRSLCMMIVYVGFTSLAAKYGDNELALSSIMMKMFMLFSYFVDGFAYAGEALVGKYVGQKNYDKITLSVRYLFAWTIAIGLLFTGIYAFAGSDVVMIFTTDNQIAEGSKKYLIWLIAMPLVSCAAFMWDGIYIGATAGKSIRNSMIWAAASFVVCYLAFCSRFGMHALYFAYFAHLLARAVYLQIKWKPTYKTITKI